MAKYFSKTLFLSNLKRFWPLSVAIFIVAFFSFVVPELGSSRMFWSYYTSEVKDIMPSLIVFCTVFIPIFSIFTAVAVFGYLHKLKAAGFVSVLPVSRLGLYITNWISGLTIMLAPTLFIGMVYGVLLINQPVPAGHFMIWIAMIIFIYLIFYSIAVFTTFLTGKPLMHIFLFGLFNCFIIILYFIVYYLLENLVYGFEGISDLFESREILPVVFLTPVIAIPLMILSFSPLEGAADVFTSVIPWVIYPLLICLMIYFGYKMYKNRPIESAGSVLVHKPLKSVIKYLIGILTGAMFGFPLTSILDIGNRFSMTAFIVCLALSFTVFGVLGCLFSEMLIRKSLRVWKSAYKGMIFFALAVFAIFTIIRLDGFGYERRVPDPDRVVAVSFSQTNVNNNAVLFLSDRDLSKSEQNRGSRWRLTEYYINYKKELGLPILTQEVINEIKIRTVGYFESPEAIETATLLHRAILDDKTFLERPADNLLSNDSRIVFFTLLYKMDNGQTLERQYKMAIGASDFNSTDALYELYALPEPTEKRCRFVLLPDTADSDISFRTQNISSNRTQEVEDIDVPESDLPALISAMRKDFALGTLGIIDLSLSLGQLMWSQKDEMQSDVYRVAITYDRLHAGIPAAFEDLCPKCEGTVCTDTGTGQSVIVTTRNVNTIQVLRSIVRTNKNNVEVDLGA